MRGERQVPLHGPDSVQIGTTDFEDFYSSHREHAESYFINRGHAFEEAQDLAQNTFTRILNHWDDIDFIHPGYMFTVAKRLSINQVRDKSRKPTVELWDSLVEPSESARPTEEAVLKRIDSQIEINIFRSLRPEVQELFYKHENGETLAKLAEDVGTTENAMKSRLVRARKLMRRRAKKYYEA